MTGSCPPFEIAELAAPPRRFASPLVQICEETGDEVILMKDISGRVIGFEKLNFSFAKPGPLRVAFETLAV